MAKPKSRTRDAGSGRIVTAAEAKARPKETVTEKGGPSLASLARRMGIIEQALSEDGGRLSDKFIRLSNR